MWYTSLTTELNSDRTVTAQVSTDSKSPWYSGHFPGDPILPGVAQLHMVSSSIARALGQELVLSSMGRIKFKKLLRPGDVLDIHAEPGKTDNHYSFQITSGQQQVCSGRLVLTPKKEE